MHSAHSLLFTVKSRLKTGLLHVLLIAVAIIALMPVIWMFTTSVKPLEEVYAYPPKWIPGVFMVENYLKAWNAAPFTQYTINSVFVTGTIIFSQLFFAVLAAYVFARLQFPGRDLIFLAFLATMMIPTQVVVVPTFLIFKVLGWIDTYMGLTVPFLVSAFGTFLIRQSFMAIPEELIDAARIDGAGHARIIWNRFHPQFIAGLSKLCFADIYLALERLFLAIDYDQLHRNAHAACRPGFPAFQ